jgi:hypothetical protein
LPDLWGSATRSDQRLSRCVVLLHLVTGSILAARRKHKQTNVQSGTWCHALFSLNDPPCHSPLYAAKLPQHRAAEVQHEVEADQATCHANCWRNCRARTTWQLNLVLGVYDTVKTAVFQSILLVLIVGCQSTEVKWEKQTCWVPGFYKGAGFGLVEPVAEVKKSMLAQLPDGLEAEDICWYSSAPDRVEAHTDFQWIHYEGARTYPSGKSRRSDRFTVYTFMYREGKWMLVQKHEEISTQ